MDNTMKNDKKSPLRALICDEMKAQHITQSELARRIGVTRQEINNFLNGHRAIPFDKLEKICTELKII